MPTHEIALRHEGRRHYGLRKGSITLGVEQIAHPFQFEYAEELNPGTGDAWRLEAGDFVELLIDGEVAVDGYLDSDRIKRRPGEYTFEVAGRAPPADLVDCASMARPRMHTQARAREIVAKIAHPFGFEVVLGEGVPPGAPFKRFVVDKGETAYEAILRVCKMRSMLPRYVPGARRIELVQLDATVGSTPLTIGSGGIVMEMEREVDHSQRFSDYHFFGTSHSRDDQFGDSRKLRGKAHDPGVRRYRPTRLPARGGDGPRDPGARAILERNQRAGESEKVTCTVSGWRDGDGALWAPNTLVRVSAPELYVDARLLVVSVRYEWDIDMKDGFVTRLELKRREALDPEADYPTNESREAWS